MKPKRVVFPIAGKGGVGKTTVVATLAEWYADNTCRAELLDMDPDNKAEGSFRALFAHAHKLPALESWTCSISTTSSPAMNISGPITSSTMASTPI
jgi:cellulose biosynthesis protein BcsQ